MEYKPTRLTMPISAIGDGIVMKDFYHSPTLEDMLGMSPAQLEELDPVIMNLSIAKGIPALADLEISRFVALADRWAEDLSQRMLSWEGEFQRSPQNWNHDYVLFRLGVVCWYVDIVLGVAYREDHRFLTRVRYTNPSDLFLNGIMETRRGTCATLALLHVVLGRRVGLPVSLACVGSHFICRYDDGQRGINIETTNTGNNGFSSPTDEEIFSRRGLPQKAQGCGSDLQAVTSREMLGLFLGLRARHLENTCQLENAEPDYLLARYLFPQNRCLYVSQNMISVQCSMSRFEPGENGHPLEVAEWLQEVVRMAPWKRRKQTSPVEQEPPQEKPHASDVDAMFESDIIIGGW